MRRPDTPLDSNLVPTSGSVLSMKDKGKRKITDADSQLDGYLSRKIPRHRDTTRVGEMKDSMSKANYDNSQLMPKEAEPSVRKSQVQMKRRPTSSGPAPTERSKYGHRGSATRLERKKLFNRNCPSPHDNVYDDFSSMNSSLHPKSSSSSELMPARSTFPRSQESKTLPVICCNCNVDRPKIAGLFGCRSLQHFTLCSWQAVPPSRTRFLGDLVRVMPLHDE